MKDIRFEKTINTILILLIIIQPFLEVFYINNGNFEVFGFQISTIIRLLLFGLISLLMLLNFKNLKNKKTFIFYLVFLIIYFVLHHYNALSFYSYIPGNLNYSLFEEVFYLIRMVIPVFLIYYVWNSKFNEKNLNKSTFITLGLIIFTIFISNIFKFSLCSYNDNIISGNIFDWFINPGMYGYLSLASRGLFSNMIVYYLVILFLPIIIYQLFTQKHLNKYLSFLFIIIAMFSSFMVGTKATTLGFIIIIVVYLILTLFFTIIKKELKNSWVKICFLTLILASSFSMINFSPMLNRTSTDNKIKNDKQEVDTSKENEIEEDEIIKYLDPKDKETIKNENQNINVNSTLELIQDDNVKKLMLVELLDKHYQSYGINLQFIETSYSYKHDPFFWKNFIDTTYYFERSNNRMVVQQIFDRIFEVNNNTYDKYLGITYSRTSKVFNLERDFLYQYYSMGLIGCLLLLGPYIFVILISGIYMLVNFKNKFTLKNCSIMLGIGLVLCLSLYSGNTLENLSITMPLGIACGYLLKNVFSKEKN